MSEGAAPVVGSKRDLAAELHGLLFEAERRSGSRGVLKRTALARRIGISVSSLYAYLDGTTLPSTTVLDLLLDELDASDAQRRRLCTARDALEVSRRVRRSETPERGIVAPHELPPDVFGFTGREEQLAELTQVLAPGNGSSAVVISAVSGAGGVGKTALAVRWAHRARDRFPDGQLYADLRGYDPDTPVEPAEALGTLLRSLGVEGSDLPKELADRVARYRTLLDRRRALVVLDNAFSAEQVRPLLPGSSSCRVVVTSRDSLSGLVARDGARRLTLDRLPLSEAVGLLRALLGAAKVDADTQAAVDLAHRCERLPLALRVAAELAASRPTEPLAKLVAELDRHRLDALDLGDDRTAVRSVFSWSYRQLPVDAARAFRLIGVHPGRDFDAYALAALTNTDLDTAQRLAFCLGDTHLVEPAGQGRLRAHDLLRAYAAELAAAEPESARRDALSRLLDHYAHTASTAMDQAYPYEADHRPRIPAPHTPAPTLDDAPHATAWLDAELANLLAAAHATDHPAHTLHLSTTLRRHLRTRARYTDAETLHTHALRTACRIGDGSGELDALTSLGHIHRLQGRYETAADCFQQALCLAHAADHRLGKINALTGLGYIHSLRARHDPADHHQQAPQTAPSSSAVDTPIGLGHIHRLPSRRDPAADCFQQALDLACDIGDRVGELSALIGLGHVHYLRARHDPAIDYYQQAVVLAREIGDHGGQLSALIGLGHIHRLPSRHDPKADHYQQALDLAREIGDRGGQLNALSGLGHIHRLQGRHERAADCYQRTLDLARDIGHRAGELSALIGLGHIHRLQSSYDPAADYFRQALDLARETGDRNQQFEAQHGLSHTDLASGHANQALTGQQQALDLARALDQPEDQARAHDGLAHAHDALDQLEQARQHWQHALTILTDLDLAEVEEVNADDIRARLAKLDPERPGRRTSRDRT